MRHSFYGSLQLLQHPKALLKKGWKFLVVLLLGLSLVSGAISGILSIFIGESETNAELHAPIGFYGGNVCTILFMLPCSYCSSPKCY